VFDWQENMMKCDLTLFRLFVIWSWPQTMKLKIIINNKNKCPITRRLQVWERCNLCCGMFNSIRVKCANKQKKHSNPNNRLCFAGFNFSTKYFRERQMKATHFTLGLHTHTHASPRHDGRRVCVCVCVCVHDVVCQTLTTEIKGSCYLQFKG